MGSVGYFQRGHVRHCVLLSLLPACEAAGLPAGALRVYGTAVPLRVCFRATFVQYLLCCQGVQKVLGA